MIASDIEPYRRSDGSPIFRIDPEPVGDGTPSSVVTFHEYWQSRRGDSWAPRWADIDLTEIPPPMLPYVVVCDVLSDGDLFFRYWGSGHANYYVREFSHKKLSDMHFPWLEEILRYQYQHVIDTRRPWVFQVHYHNLDAPVPSYRSPLSNDGERVTGLLSFVPREDVETALRAWHYDPKPIP